MPHLSQTCKRCFTMESTIYWKRSLLFKSAISEDLCDEASQFPVETTWRRHLQAGAFWKYCILLSSNNVKLRLHVWPLLCLRCATQIEVFAIATEAENIWCSVAGHYSLIRSVLGPGQMFCISSLIKSTINIWFSQTIHWDETFLYTFYIFTTGLCNPENLNTYFYLVVAILEV